MYVIRNFYADGQDIGKTIIGEAELYRSANQRSEHLDRTYCEQSVIEKIVDDVCACEPKAPYMLLQETGFWKAGSDYAINPEEAAKHMGVSVARARGVLSELQSPYHHSPQNLAHILLYRGPSSLYNWNSKTTAPSGTAIA